MGLELQVYPLFLAIGTALGIAGFTMARNLSINPDVRWRIIPFECLLLCVPSICFL